MSHAISNSYPFLSIARAYDRDYGDVLNVAWGLKQLLLGAEKPNVYYGAALTAIMRDGDGEEIFRLIQQHITEFVALQGSALRSRLVEADFDVIEARAMAALGFEQTGHDEYTQIGLGTDPDLEGIRKAMTDQPEFPDEPHHQKDY